MSTKTTFKRVALVAVAALGFGMVSTVSANAVAASTATVGTPVRTGITTWTIAVSLAVTGADDCVAAAGGADYTLSDGGVTPLEGAAGVTGETSYATSAVTVGDALGTAGSSTTATVTGVITITAVSISKANVAAAAGIYAGKIALVGPGDCDVAESGSTTFTIASPAAGSFLAGSGTAYSGSAGALTQVAGGLATFVMTGGSSDTSYTVTATGGTITSATATTAPVLNNGLNYAGGITWTPGTNVQNLTIGVTNTASGTTTLTFVPLASNGVPGTSFTSSVTWIGAGSNGISAANSFVGATSSAAACTAIVGADHTADVNNFTALATSQRLFYKAVAGDTTKRFLCIILRDANGVAVDTGATAVSVISPIGFVAGAHSAAIGTDATGSVSTQITGDTLSTGASTFTVVATDVAGNTITMTAPFSFYGSIATLTLTQEQFAGAYGDSTYAAPLSNSVTTTKSEVAALSAKDANGNTASLNASHSSASYNGVISTITRNGSSNASTPTRGNGDTAGATATVGTDTAAAYVAGTWSGSYALYVDCSNSTKAEKVSIYLSTLKSDGLTYADSNSVDFYCSDATSKLTVTPSATEGAPGAAVSFNVTAVDENGYPVADGTSISLVSNNGSGLTTNSKTTSNGTFKSTSVPSVVLGSTGPVNVTALNGGKTASAQIAVTGGTADATSAAADAAAEATDAANAATDAANAAAEAADAATAAAQDAADAVAALSAQVSTMISALKAQLTSLTNLVIKIQKKVKA